MRVLSLLLLLSLAVPTAAQTPPANRPSVPSPPPKESSPLPTLSMVVSQRDRDAAFAYYRDEAAAGRCPAPLVRKGKACEPPAPPASRAWRLDVPLPDG